MSNNSYTSPRLYASKTYSRNKRAPLEQGIGYVLPAGIAHSDFKKLYAEWEQKLQKSGFTDIEYRNKSHTGTFTPFFRQNGSTATFMRAYDPSKESYYRLCRHFQNDFDFKAAFGRQATLYKTLWYLHTEGVPYRAVAKAFSGKPTKWMKGLEPVPKHLKMDRSVFWAHDHTHKILDFFWKWAKDYEGGLDDPR